MRIAVVYLRYWPYGLEPWERFLNAYTAHDAGVEHSLIVVNHRQPVGSDMGHYRNTVSDVKADAYCFLNCHSEPLCANWLRKLSKALDDDVGIAGATGSYESGAGSFPNPHIRTTGFMLKRDIALALEWGTCENKQAAWQLECGPNSLTRQVIGMGLRPVVVGRDGVYPLENWQQAGVYRQGEQENLLIADNRTRDYQNGPRRYLADLAWSG